MNKNIFIGEDGLNHCSVCKEPLEMVFPSALMGKDFKVHIGCACQRKIAEEEEKEREIRRHEIEVRNNRMICFHEKRMRDWTFSNDNGKTAAMDKARAYVEHWDEVREKGAGLLLWGGVGSGKTYMAACIANALLDQEKKVLMTDFVTITNISMYDVHEYVNALSRYDLLIIDDLGAERKTEFAVQNVFDVINRRWESGKPLIITTKLPLDALKGEVDMEKGRIYDRILDMCTPVMVVGESKRIESANHKKEFFSEIFLGEKGGIAHE